MLAAIESTEPAAEEIALKVLDTFPEVEAATSQKYTGTDLLSAALVRGRHATALRLVELGAEVSDALLASLVEVNPGRPIR